MLYRLCPTLDHPSRLPRKPTLKCLTIVTSILVDPLQNAKAYNTIIDGYYTFESHSSNQFLTNCSLKVFVIDSRSQRSDFNTLHWLPPFFNFQFTCYVTNYFANFTYAVPLYQLKIKASRMQKTVAKRYATEGDNRLVIYRRVLWEIACRRRAFRHWLTKLVGTLVCSSRSVLVATCMLSWQCGDRVWTLGWKRLLASAMARMDVVEMTSTTLPCQYDNSPCHPRTRHALKARFFECGQRHTRTML